MLSAAEIAQLGALGLFTGFMAGLLGIGGGMLLVPLLTMILGARMLPPDLAVKMAIATAMATILFTSLSSVYAHHRKGAVRWDIVGRLAPGIAIGGLLASLGVFSLLKGHFLALFFGVFVGFSALKMLRAPQKQVPRTMPGRAGQMAAGGVIGFLSGLVGAGGGFISVPFMARRSVPMHNAVATSAALGFPIAAINVLGYAMSGQSSADLPAASVGYIWLPGLVTIALCSVLTAPLGARAAHALPVAQLKRIFALLLLALAAYMLYKGMA